MPSAFAIVEADRRKAEDGDARFGTRGLDRCSKVIRAVQREEIDAVALVAAAGKIDNRHELDSGDAEFHQVIELADEGTKSAFRCEGLKMKLVDHGLIPRTPSTRTVTPFVCGGVNRLPVQSGIWRRQFLPAIFHSLHVRRLGVAPRRGESLLCWRPKAKRTEPSGHISALKGIEWERRTGSAIQRRSLQVREADLCVADDHSRQLSGSLPVVSQPSARIIYP